MSFLSKLVRKVGRAIDPTKQVKRVTKAVKKVTRSKGLVGAIANASPVAGLVGAVAQKAGDMSMAGTLADMVKRKNAMAQQMAEGTAAADNTAVGDMIAEGNVSPASPLSTLTDPSVAGAAEADRKRKLGVSQQRGKLRRTIIG